MFSTVIILAVISVIVISIYTLIRPFTPFNEDDLRRKMNNGLNKTYYGKPKKSKR